MLVIDNIACLRLEFNSGQAIMKQGEASPPSRHCSEVRGPGRPAPLFTRPGALETCQAA